MQLLKKLCEIPSPSGNEVVMKNYLLNYIENQREKWKYSPEVIHGDEFQDCIILKFGNPRVAVYAHIDTIGFTVRYQNQLIPIGGPHIETGYCLIGKDGLGPIECSLVDEVDKISFQFGRGIERGTNLTFKPNFIETEDFVQSPYLDNRIGIYNALRLCEELDNGVIIFSCWEEHGGGTVPFLTKFIYEQYKIKKALISDVTWVTEGILPGKGVAISMRDSAIPRQEFVKKIIQIAEESKVDFQLEVENSGGSDGREIQSSPYPIDWCFIGPPEENVHSPQEKVHKHDIESMITLYRALLKKL